MYFQAAHFPLGPQKGAFYRGQFVIWPRVLIMVSDNYTNYFIVIVLHHDEPQPFLDITSQIYDSQQI